MSISAEILGRLKTITGPQGWLDSEKDLAPHLTELRGLYHGAVPLLLLPATTSEVSAIVRECAAHKVSIVPQGGNTGLVGGQIPSADGDQVLVNLARMNHIRDLNPEAATITVEAGCILADVQAAAEAADLLFTLSLAAESSCQIGGNLATNAGGTQVLRYGTTRALTLGLEVVMADGQIWGGLRTLTKDNTGYDLKHLFIGSEGTLGIITAAVLRLFPRPQQSVTAVAGVANIDHAIHLMNQMQNASGGRATAFELMSGFCVELAITHMSGISDPLSQPAPWYALMEFHGGYGDDLSHSVETGLARLLGEGVALDAVIAQNESQAQSMWKLRESLPYAQTREGASIKHDIGIPVTRATEFVRACATAVEAEVPDGRLVVFGHLGDGNLHVNVAQPSNMERDAFMSRRKPINEIVHDLAVKSGGTFSAEHGIGQLKRGEMLRHKSEVELKTMRAIKSALDPSNIFNPGKIL